MFLKTRPLSRFGIYYCAKSYKLSYSQNAIASPASTPTEGITISENCVQKLKQLCADNDKFLRLCVESGGCSGFQYKFDLDSKTAEDDR